MHPAYSIIFFTVASGTGYGLITVSLLALIFGLVPFTASFAWSTLIIGSVLVKAGLLSSTFHLGRPERAWRALSQWRTSWLSREGVLAIITFAPIVATALSWWTGQGWWIVSGFIAAALSMVTVYCTAMIYASLKPIPAWHDSLVPAAYIILSLAGGSVITALLAAVTTTLTAAVLVLALLSVMAAAVIKYRYWQKIAEQRLPSTTASAIGLKGRGTARLLELPHSSKNYLQREMGFRVARKHAQKLRLIASVAIALTLILLIGSFSLSGMGASIMLVFATAFLTTALIIERWLFFAEARHTVSLYYGEDQ